jgi:hypothetical protein
MSFIKKVLLCIMLWVMPLSAKWESFYARGAFSLRGLSSDEKFSFVPLFAIGGGYGNVIPNILSHGLYVGVDIEGIRKNQFGYSHEAIIRFGFPRAQCMFYVAPKIGYHSTNEFMIWGARVGIDFDFILPGFFWGVSLDWSIPFKDRVSWLQTDFSFGYRF